MFTVITDRVELEDAFKIWKTTFENGNENYDDDDIYWHSNEKLLAHLKVDEYGDPNKIDRIACALGSHEHQFDLRKPPSVQLNVGLEARGSTNGRIVRDKNSNLFLAHKGGLRGGANNISMAVFNSRFRGTPKASVILPDNSSQDHHIFGPISSPILKVQLGYFVAEAERIRKPKRPSKPPVTASPRRPVLGRQSPLPTHQAA